MAKGDKVIQLAILALIDTNKPVLSWRDICLAVQAKVKIAPTGWMQVRDVLQGFLEVGFLKRVPSVHVEEYEVLPAAQR